MECRTSPSRNWPVTSGVREGLSLEVSILAISNIVFPAPLPMLNISKLASDLARASIVP